MTDLIANGTFDDGEDGTRILIRESSVTNVVLHIPDDFRFSVANGTTLNAEFHRLNSLGNWVLVYDVNSHTTLDGAKEFIVRGGGKFSINVTTATGTWDWEVVRLK